MEASAARRGKGGKSREWVVGFDGVCELLKDKGFFQEELGASRLTQEGGSMFVQLTTELLLRSRVANALRCYSTREGLGKRTIAELTKMRIRA